MKLRKTIGYPYLDLTTGYLQIGNYEAEAITKIAVLRRNNTPILLPTYYPGNKFKLKASFDILGYRLVYCGNNNIFNEENYKFIERYFHDIKKVEEALKFLSSHYKELKQVFKDEETYNYYMLRLIFELGELPYGFEITYKGKLINNFSTAKEMWKDNNENFSIISK